MELLKTLKLYPDIKVSKEDGDLKYLDINVKGELIKVITNFKDFFIIENANNKHLKEVNCQLIANIPLSWNHFMKLVANTSNDNVTTNSKVSYDDDQFNIFKINEFTKFPILKEALYEHDTELRKSFPVKVDRFKSHTSILNPTIIRNTIFSEIEKINSNKSYPHYIVPIDGLYKLEVRFKFTSKKHKKIFATIKEKFGYDYASMHLDLNPQYYPYTPPDIKFIKPNINSDLLMKLHRINVFTAKNWNPIINLEWIILNIAKVIEDTAVFNIDSILNEAKDGIAFSKLEYHLINLCKEIDDPISDPIIFDINKITQDDKAKAGGYWKKGTGYGHGDSVWDIKKFIEEQDKAKNQLCIILNAINEELNADNSAFVSSSVLPKFILNKIKDTSLMEINKQIDLYQMIFQLINNLFNLNAICDIDKAIYADNFSRLASDVEIITCELYGKEEEIRNHIILLSSIFTPFKKNIVEEIVIPTEEKDKYSVELSKHSFGNLDIISAGIPYQFSVNAKSKLTDQKTIIRLAQEIASLKNSLPTTWSSSIWLRWDRKSINSLQFMISGPEGTPYQDGLFLFDAYFPPSYPIQEPKVLLQTTGKGSVRFNPNLYNCGKVCLSLLGTWSGTEGEKWNEKTSTFLQVLISIQSLIFVDEPYFNEPGYERSIGTPQGIQNSFAYNDNIRKETVAWGMIDMIKNPPKGFEEVVALHFKNKKTSIKALVDKWTSETKSWKTKFDTCNTELTSLFEALT